MISISAVEFFCNTGPGHSTLVMFLTAVSDSIKENCSHLCLGCCHELCWFSSSQSCPWGLPCFKGKNLRNNELSLKVGCLCVCSHSLKSFRQKPRVVLLCCSRRVSLALLPTGSGRPVGFLWACPPCLGGFPHGYMWGQLCSHPLLSKCWHCLNNSTKKRLIDLEI